MSATAVPQPIPSTAGIAVEGLRRSFGDVHAVRDVSFEAPPGAVTALVGPNGSGKTTLLLMLASLLRPDAGTIRIGGVDPVSDPQGARALLGWMPDALGAWASLTARETLVTTGRMYRLPRAVAEARAEQLLHTVRLDPLADKPARVLSRGQKQRLGLARALVHDPAVLLLDEPASGLDPQSRIDLRILLRQFAAEGRTVLVSSHVLSELEELSDLAVFIQAGATVSGERLAQSRVRLRDWRVRAVDGPDAVLAALVSVGFAETHARRDRDEVLLAFDSDRAAAETLSALVAAGLLVAEFTPATGRLEQTFLDLAEAPEPSPSPLAHPPAAEPEPPSSASTETGEARA